jgi:hypothetical protein
VEGLHLDLSLLLETVHNVLVAPADLVGQALVEAPSANSFESLGPYYAHLDGAVFAARFQSQHPERFGDDHALLTVVGWGHALKQFETLERSSAPRALVRCHAADGPVQNLGRRAVVKWAGLFGVHNMAFVEKVVVSEL